MGKDTGMLCYTSFMQRYIIHMSWNIIMAYRSTSSFIVLYQALNTQIYSVILPLIPTFFVS